MSGSDHRRALCTPTMPPLTARPQPACKKTGEPCGSCALTETRKGKQFGRVRGVPVPQLEGRRNGLGVFLVNELARCAHCILRVIRHQSNSCARGSLPPKSQKQRRGWARHQQTTKEAHGGFVKYVVKISMLRRGTQANQNKITDLPKKGYNPRIP